MHIIIMIIFIYSKKLGCTKLYCLEYRSTCTCEKGHAIIYHVLTSSPQISDRQAGTQYKFVFELLDLIDVPVVLVATKCDKGRSVTYILTFQFPIKNSKSYDRSYIISVEV